MGKINTNMASEFWFYSQLHRLGYQSFITLGNTKAIDILVRLSDGSILTFDVKGKENFNSGTYQYLPETKSDYHFFVFIGLQIKKEKKKTIFEGEPECYIVNSNDLDLIAFHWTASNKVTKGYGFDQKILRIIKKYDNEMVKMSKADRKKLESFKNFQKRYNFMEIKNKIMCVEDFENKFFDKK
ncbi:MAG TPA: hypothetical protein VIK14_12520 [Ignavibacteria bacterium]